MERNYGNILTASSASKGTSPCALVCRRLRFLQTPSPFLINSTLTVIYMRGLALFAAKKKFKQIWKLKGSGPFGVMTTSPQKKQANNEFSEEKPITKANIDPVVTFSRPPPFPPVLGPLVALTLLETWLNGDTDGKS